MAGVISIRFDRIAPWRCSYPPAAKELRKETSRRRDIAADPGAEVWTPIRNLRWDAPRHKMVSRKTIQAIIDAT